MRSENDLNISGIQNARLMEEYEEILGDLKGLEEHSGWVIAQIGRISVLLPSEMAPKLRELLGRRMGVLRCEGYRLRAM